MSNITNSEYWAEVASLAANIVEESADHADCNTLESFDEDTIREKIFDTVLHETIDSHSWVIYYAYNLDVLQHSKNEDYMIENLGLESAGESLKQGLSTLHCHLAFWSLYADVSDYLDDAICDYHTKLEESNEE